MFGVQLSEESLRQKFRLVCISHKLFLHNIWKRKSDCSQQSSVISIKLLLFQTFANNSETYFVLRKEQCHSLAPCYCSRTSMICCSKSLKCANSSVESISIVHPRDIHYSEVHAGTQSISKPIAAAALAG